MNLALSEAGRRIIDAVIEAPVAWRSPGELAGRLGWPEEQTLDEIAELDAAGWLEAWELVDGPVVTLSVAGSALCGVRLVEVGFDETPRWARPGDPDPSGLRAPGVFRGEPAAALGLLADARPSAEQVAIQAEEAQGRALLAAAASGRPGAADAFPRPTILIGGGLSPWPGPLQASASNCPACRSGRLPALAYCLWCDRWGLDLDAAPPRAAVDAPRRAPGKPSAPAKETQDVPRRREVERRKRRQKRKERCKLQMAEFCAWSRRANRERPGAVAP